MRVCPVAIAFQLNSRTAACRRRLRYTALSGSRGSATDPLAAKLGSAERDAKAGAADLAASLLLMLAVWTILIGLTPLLERIAGADAALLLTSSLAATLVLAARRRQNRPVRRWLPRGVLGFAAGFVGLPAWVALIAFGGFGIGLAPARSVAAGAGEPADWLVAVVVAPVLEELLYRERLLAVLWPRLGSLAAIACSSAAFALPHLRPWGLLGAGIVGAGLGTLYSACGSIALCIGLHAGLNTAAIVCGLPPARWALSPGDSALAGWSPLVAVALLGRLPANGRQACS